MVARSKANSGKSITGNCALLRSNSIRRSNALERKMGKRARTFSRSFRKSDAINDVFIVCQPGNARGSAIGLVQKDPAIKRLVIGTHHRQPRIGIEMLACQIGQPQRHIGKFWKPLGFFRICSKTSRIDENLAPIEATMENIAEQFG